MSIRSSIVRTHDDNLPVSKKSYRDIKLRIDLVNAKEFINQDPTDDMRKRLYKVEYKVDGVENIYKMYSKDGQNITMNQIKDIFDDIGFNTDTTLSGIFGSDIVMVYNIGGYMIPFYKEIINFLFKKSRYRNSMLTKFSLGKKRLHCRVYEGSDGNWYVTSHVDEANWPDLMKLWAYFKAHWKRGTGNYEMGTKLMGIVLNMAQERLSKSQRIFVDINEIYKKLKEEAKTNGNIQP